MTTPPPIIPGNPQPEDLPTAPVYYEPTAAYQPPPPPQPVYFPQPQPVQQGWNPGRAAGNTVVVLLTLVGIFCVLPIVGCSLLALFGSIGRH